MSMMNCRLALALAASLLLAVAFDASAADAKSPQTVLGIDGEKFIINGQPTFLLGISYYGGLGADEETWRRDFDKFEQYGFNWLRVWATWSAFGEDWAAVDPATGEPRQPFLASLEKLVADCDRRGIVVDVTLSRGKPGSGSPRLTTHESHARAVRTLVETLKPYRNWYLDLSNERNIGDSRHTSIDELHELRELVRQLDGERLVTASHGGDIGSDELPGYLHEVGIDFITPHRPRDASSPKQTESKTREYLAAMRKLGRVVPVHYQEPFRRGYDKGWQPSADDFLNDLAQSRAGGAAGWCFHNGDQRGAAEGRPRRSFDLSEQSLLAQLDAEEQQFIERLTAQRER